jgi:hypothetical protein
VTSYGFFSQNKFLTQFFRFHLLKIDKMTGKSICHLALIISQNKVN